METNLDISNKAASDTYVQDEKITTAREEVRVSPLVADDHGFVTNEQELPKGYYRSPYFIGTFFATFLSQQAGTSTYLMTSTLLRYINADIGPSEDNSWIPTIYILSTAIGLLLFGRWSDIFGRRWFFIGASLLGLIGSIVCATAHNIPTVIGGEVLIGLGATAGSLSCNISISDFIY
jgi:MFS family permease